MRRALLVGMSTLALPLAALVPTQASSAQHSQAVRPAAGAGVGAEVRYYRLVTGDTARVATRAGGVVSASIVGRTPYLWTGGPRATYVVPRTPSVRSRALDLSLFDTAALARVTRHGRVPIVLRLAPGAKARDITGVRLDAGSKRSVGRSTEVDATYGPHFAGFSTPVLRRLASVRLNAASPQVNEWAADVTTHTVRVHVARGNGGPADFALVTLQDTVDGDAYLEQAYVDDASGVATFDDVPEGEYSVVVQTFEKVLVDRQFDVAADLTVEMNLGLATVRPRATLPGHRALWTTLTVERDPEQGFGIPFGLAAPHFSMRVQPTSGRVRHGALHTGVSATFVTGHASTGYDHVAITNDVAKGIPADPTYVHHRREFARVTDQFFANGPAAMRPLMVFSGSTRLEFAFNETDLDVPVPGRLRVWVQAGHGSYLQQTVFPLATEENDSNNTQVGDIRRYPNPGGHAPISFLHGPVGPGLELGPHSRSSSGAHRQGDQLQLFVPIISGSGPGHAFDFADPKDATWSLREGRHVVAHGHQSIYRTVDVAHGRRTFRLTATTHPGKSWDLSTRVRDRWTFESRAGRHAVPLLTPSYVPPTDRSGNLGPGRTGYRLSFHSTPHSARVASVSVELSTDNGRTWRPARVTRTSGLTFHVGYRNPAATAGRRYVSLRVTARDVHGSSVEETTLHAYRLR